MADARDEIASLVYGDCGNPIMTANGIVDGPLSDPDVLADLLDRLDDDTQARVIARTRMGQELLGVVSLIDPGHFSNWLSPGWLPALYLFRKEEGLT